MTFTRARQRAYRNRPINNGLAALVLAVAEGKCPPEVLRDWLLDNPMHSHDLSRLLWRGTVEYVERDRNKLLDDIGIKNRRRERWGAMDAMEADLHSPLRGLANSCIRDACRKVLNIDHMGRSLSPAGFPLGWSMLHDGTSSDAERVAVREDRR